MIADVALILPTPVCRLCKRAGHYIENCQSVIRAFVDGVGVFEPRERFCSQCGAAIVKLNNDRRAVCDDCTAQRIRERVAVRLDKQHHGLAWRNGQSSKVGNQLRVIDGVDEFQNGAILVGWIHSLNSGHLAPGMIVRYIGKTWRVEGAPLERQHLVNVDDPSKVMWSVRNHGHQDQLTMSVKAER